MGGMRALPPAPGRGGDLDLLRDAGLRLATLTNNDPEVAEDQLGNAGIARPLRADPLRDTVRRLKPAPEPYQHGGQEPRGRDGRGTPDRRPRLGRGGRPARRLRRRVRGPPGAWPSTRSSQRPDVVGADSARGRRSTSSRPKGRSRSAPTVASAIPAAAKSRRLLPGAHLLLRHAETAATATTTVLPGGLTGRSRVGPGPPLPSCPSGSRRWWSRAGRPGRWHQPTTWPTPCKHLNQKRRPYRS